jgi:hypothetical protein
MFYIKYNDPWRRNKSKSIISMHHSVIFKTELLRANKRKKLMIGEKLNASNKIEDNLIIPCMKWHIVLGSFHVKQNQAFKRENQRCRILVWGTVQEKKEHDTRGL